MTDANTIRDALQFVPDVVANKPTRKDLAYRALDRLEAQLAELRAFKDEALATDWIARAVEAEADYESQREYADEQYRARLAAESERDALRDELAEVLRLCEISRKAAESRISALEEALRQIADSPYGRTTNVGDMAHAALGAKEGT